MTSRNTTLYALIILAFVAMFVMLIGVTMVEAGASGASSPAPAAVSAVSTDTTATAAPLSLVRSTKSARREALILWAKDTRVRDCFERRAHKGPGRLPARQKPEAVWRSARAQYRSLKAQLRAEVKMLRHKMRNPGQPVNGERWRALALYVGWSRAEWPTVLYIMSKRGGTGESGGWPLALNKSSKCGGLMQIHPMFYWGVWAIRGVKEAFNWRDPEINLRKALGIRRDAHGFGPWAM